MHGPSVKDTRERAASPIELQDLAKKLAALARQIKTIAATPLSEGGRFGRQRPNLYECSKAASAAIYVTRKSPKAKSKNRW